MEDFWYVLAFFQLWLCEWQNLFLSPGIVDDFDAPSGLYSACKFDAYSGVSDCLIYEADGTIEARVEVSQRPSRIPPYVVFVYE